MSDFKPSYQFHLQYGSCDLTLTYPNRQLFERHIQTQESIAGYLDREDGLAWRSEKSPETAYPVKYGMQRIIKAVMEPTPTPRSEGIIFSRKGKDPSHIYLTEERMIQCLNWGIITHKDGERAIWPDLTELYMTMKQDMLRSKNTCFTKIGAEKIRVLHA